MTAHGAQRRAHGRVRDTRPRGFTLLELLITMSVTTIGLIGLLSLHVSVSRGNDGASRSAEAQQIAVTELESLRALGLVPMMAALTGSASLTFPTAPRVRTTTGRGAMTYTVTTQASTLPGTSASLVKIRTVVSWTDDGGTAGSNGGQLDHQLALEVIRTMEEAL